MEILIAIHNFIWCVRTLIFSRDLFGGWGAYGFPVSEVNFFFFPRISKEALVNSTNNYY